MFPLSFITLDSSTTNPDLCHTLFDACLDVHVCVGAGGSSWGRGGQAEGVVCGAAGAAERAGGGAH